MARGRTKEYATLRVFIRDTKAGKKKGDVDIDGAALQNEAAKQTIANAVFTAMEPVKAEEKQ